MTLCALLAAAAAGWIGTGLVRRYALRKSLLDIPNSRSLHVHPTPRGGGAAIAAVTLGGIALAATRSLIEPPLAWALVVGGGAVALVGWIDDRRRVPAPLRAAVHLVAAVAVLGGTGVTGTMSAGAVVLAALWIVWSTNLYNFMDGVDGLAGIEGVSVGALGGVMLLSAGRYDLALVLLLVGAASFGFLAWNWPPAKVFMGDVGSGFLGFIFGAMTVVSDRSDAVPAVTWVMLLGVFIFDATVTLLRRIAAGERWYEAHRSHAYQRLVRAGVSPARVDLAGLFINIGAAALAWIARTDTRLRPLGVLAEVVVLSVLYWVIERRFPMAAGKSSR